MKKVLFIVFFLMIASICTQVFAEPDKFLSGPTAINTSTYTAYGTLIYVDSDTIAHFARQGTNNGEGDPPTEGVITLEFYDISDGTWGSRSTIYTKAGYDCRDPHGGIIGSKFYIFTGCKPTAGGYPTYGNEITLLVSTDLTGSSWSNSIVDSTGLGAGNDFQCYGNIVATGTAGKYYEPCWSTLSGYKVFLLQTLDSGATWARGPVLQTVSGYDETSVAYLGDDTFIAIMRKTAGGNVYQSISTDGGITWSTPESTGLGASSSVKVGFVYYHEPLDRVMFLFCDRNTSTLRKSIASRANALANNWPTDISIASTGLGYTSFVPIDISLNKFMVGYYLQNSSTDADFFWGIYNEFYGSIRIH